jgi:hypothetical protein
MQWLVENMDWLFSGLGITVISLVIWLFRKNRIDENMSNSQEVKNIKAGGNVQINQTINEAKQIPDQIHITLLSLKQMPGRLQESVNSGVTSFSFDETRLELEKLYALAQASGDDALVSSIETFQGNYNRYIELINLAIKSKATLEEVNNYHKQNIVRAFENAVKFRD